MKKSYNLGLGFAIILGVWWMLHLFVDPRFIPSPWSTLLTTVSLFMKGSFILHIAYSLWRLIAAIISALILGSFMGIIIAMNKPLEKVLGPIIYILFPVPKAAFLPILFVMFGLGDLSKIILIHLILFFQITVAVYEAVLNIPTDLFLAAKSLQLSRWNLYKHVIIPAIIPNIFTALRISVGIGVAVLFFVETYATRYGLGYYIMNNWSLLNYENMYSGILVLGAVGYGIFRLIDIIEKKYVRWR
jgi:NitT/TauT family transport system permease protein